MVIIWEDLRNKYTQTLPPPKKKPAPNKKKMSAKAIINNCYGRQEGKWVRQVVESEKPLITVNRVKKQSRHRKVRLISGKEFWRIKSSNFTVEEWKYKNIRKNEWWVTVHDQVNGRNRRHLDLIWQWRRNTFLKLGEGETCYNNKKLVPFS